MGRLLSFCFDIEGHESFWSKLGMFHYLRRRKCINFTLKFFQIVKDAILPLTYFLVLGSNLLLYMLLVKIHLLNDSFLWSFDVSRLLFHHYFDFILDGSWHTHLLIICVHLFLVFDICEYQGSKLTFLSNHVEDLEGLQIKLRFTTVNKLVACAFNFIVSHTDLSNKEIKENDNHYNLVIHPEPIDDNKCTDSFEIIFVPFLVPGFVFHGCYISNRVSEHLHKVNLLFAETRVVSCIKFSLHYYVN